MTTEQAEAAKRAESLARVKADGRVRGEAMRELLDYVGAFAEGIQEGASGVPVGFHAKQRRRVSWGWLTFSLGVGLLIGLIALGATRSLSPLDTAICVAATDAMLARLWWTRDAD